MFRRRIRRLFRWPVGKISYLLRDEFTTDRAAGSVDGTAAEPGPGTRTVRDVENKLSVASGVLDVDAQATPAWGEEDLVYADVAFTRTAGRLVIATWSVSADGAAFPLAFVKSTTPTLESFVDVDIGYQRAAELGLAGTTNEGQGPVIVAYTAETEYLLALVQATTGGYFFVKGGAFTYWTLVWFHRAGTSTPLYVCTANRLAEYTMDLPRVPDVLWLPTPLAYDTFTRANGALGNSETTGPDSQAVTARAWIFDVGTWTVNTNQAQGSPTAGSELWDADAAVFTSGTYAWTVYGSNTIANVSNSLEITYVDSGLGARELLADAADLSADLTVGTWYIFQFDFKINTGSCKVDLTGTKSAYYSDTSFDTKVLTYCATNATTNYVRLSDLGTGEVVNLDNLSLKPLTLSELFASVDDSSTSDVVASVKTTLIAGTQAGLVLNLDDASSPANFVIAYHDGMNAKLEKCVAGVYTTVISAAATYAAGAALVVVKDDTSYSLYYNNAKVGNTSTISDAGIVDNTKHGLFSTHSGNRLDNFILFPRGIGNEYSDLDKY